MAPHRINIYADRQGVNESLQKRERSKTTELRPSNEDLGKNTANLLIVWQAVRAPVPFPLPLYHLLVSQMQTGRAVWASRWGPHCKAMAPVWSMISIQFTVQ